MGSAAPAVDVQTCRAAIAPDDAYERPRGDTPVGWGETALARNRYDYLFDLKRATPHWRGEPDAAYNASLWAQDTPPQPELTAAEAPRIVACACRSTHFALSAFL